MSVIRDIEQVVMDDDEDKKGPVGVDVPGNGVIFDGESSVFGGADASGADGVADEIAKTTTAEVVTVRQLVTRILRVGVPEMLSCMVSGQFTHSRCRAVFTPPRTSRRSQHFPRLRFSRVCKTRTTSHIARRVEWL